jgi:hypothetical protein
MEAEELNALMKLFGSMWKSEDPVAGACDRTPSGVFAVFV